MSTAAIAGVGAEFRRDDESTTAGNYVKLTEVNAIRFSGQSRDTIDVTDLDSTGGRREYITGFRDSGEVTLDMNWTIGGYGLLLDDFEDDDEHNYQVLYPNTEASLETFAGYVTSVDREITPDDKITLTCTIKITGAVTLES